MTTTRAPQLWKTVAWLVFCFALVIIILFEMRAPSKAVRSKTSNTVMKIAPIALSPELSLPSLTETYAETTARPILSPTRRPAPPPPPVVAGIAPKPAMKRGQFMLIGVTITKEKTIALLRELAGGKTLRVERGQVVNGLTVEKVEAEKVTLKFEDEREEVVLKIATAPRMATPPPIPQPHAGQAPQPGGLTFTPPLGQPPPGVPPGAMPPHIPPQSGVQSATPDEAMNALINRRRALRGLPPL